MKKVMVLLVMMCMLKAEHSQMVAGGEKGVFGGFDSLNVRFVGNWPFGPSEAVACDASRNLVFLGSGGGVYIIDVSDPSNPIQVSEQIHTRGFVKDIFYDPGTHRVYIAAANGGVEIWDVLNATNPQKLGNYWSTDSYSSAQGIYVVGNYAYVADSIYFRIFDVSNPSNPVELSSWGPSGTGRKVEVFVSGNYAYVATQLQGLRILDVSDPLNPQEVGSYYPPNGSVLDVYVSGNYAYLAARIDGLRIIDVSDPSNPHEVGHCDIGGNYDSGIWVSGQYAYISDGNGGHLYVIDVSDPSNPTFVTELNLPQKNPKLCGSGNYAYVSAQVFGLRVVDISTPSSPQEVGYFMAVDRALRLHPSGNHVYIATPIHVNGLRIINVSNPFSPYEVAWDSVYGNSVYVSGNYAFVGGIDGIYILDVSDPSNPQEIGHYGPPPRRILQVVGNYAYASGSYSVDSLYILDVSNPSTPSLIGAEAITTYFIYNGCVSGNYIYIACSNDGLAVVDISNPSNPNMVFKDTTVKAKDVYFSTPYLYVSAGADGLMILDTSQLPDSLIEVGSYNTIGSSEGVFVSDGYAYIADYRNGVRVIDVSDPTSPFEYGYYITPGRALDVYVSNNLIYLATSETGLQIYERLSVNDDELSDKHTTIRSVNTPLFFDTNITLKFPQRIDYAHFVLYNLSGTSVYKGTLYDFKNLVIHGNEIKNLGSGIYILHVYNKDFNRKFRLFKIK